MDFRNCISFTTNWCFRLWDQRQPPLRKLSSSSVGITNRDVVGEAKSTVLLRLWLREKPPPSTATVFALLRSNVSNQIQTFLPGSRISAAYFSCNEFFAWFWIGFGETMSSFKPFLWNYTIMMSMLSLLATRTLSPIIHIMQSISYIATQILWLYDKIIIFWSYFCQFLLLLYLKFGGSNKQIRRYLCLKKKIL